MRPSPFFVNASCLAVTALLAACGGGGGSAANPPTVSTAISTLKAPADFSFATFKHKTLTSASLLQAVGGFSATTASQTYVKAWYQDAAGQRQQVLFMTLAGLQALGVAGAPLQIPGDITALKFEIYEAGVFKSGEVTL